MKYLIKTLRLKMSQSKFHADLASIDNTTNSAGSRRRYVGHWQLHRSTRDLPVTYAIYASNQPIIHMCKFNSIYIDNLIAQVFIKGLCHNRTFSPHSYSVILLQFTETSSNLATAQTTKTILRPPSPVAPFTSLEFSLTWWNSIRMEHHHLGWS